MSLCVRENSVIQDRQVLSRMTSAQSPAVLESGAEASCAALRPDGLYQSL